MKAKKVEQLAWFSFFMYLLNSTLKIAAGYYYNAQAVLADGLHNTTDCMSMLFIIVGVRLASRPVDDNHRYGHQKTEAIATLIVSVLILAVGVNVIWTNVKNLIADEFVTPDTVSATVASICGTIILITYFINRHYANKLNNLSLKAIATDNLSDALTSYATAIAVVFSRTRLKFLDQLMAVGVGFLIVKSGIDVFKESYLILTDGFPPELATSYEEEIEGLEGVKAVKRLQGRQYGSGYIIDVIILVDKNLSVVEGHDITEVITSHMLDKHPEIMEVLVHVEPYMDDLITELRDDHIQQNY